MEGPGETAWWVERLLCKREDWILDPQEYTRTSGRCGSHPVTPALETETGNHQAGAVNQTDQTTQSQLHIQGEEGAQAFTHEHAHLHTRVQKHKQALTLKKQSK